jgi:hypothetical protein
MAIPPQQNPNVAPQQDAAVMQAMKPATSPMDNPQVQQAKQELLALMQETGLTPPQLKDLGKAAEMAIRDKRGYPLFLKKLRQAGLADAEDLRGDIDYQALATFATAARMM